MTNADPPPCRATLVAQPDDYQTIRFELTNATDSVVELESYQPFLQFQLRAVADGHDIPVVQPMRDLPLHLVPLTIPSRGSIVITLPIRIVIGPDATPSTDRFTRTIVHDPDRLVLELTVELPPPFGGRCPTTSAAG